MAAMKFCPRCTRNTIPKGIPRCGTCEVEYQEDKITRNARHQLYDQTKRNKESASIYGNSHWKATKRRAKRRDNGLCVLCVDDDRIGFADIGHHIIEVSEAPHLAYDINNVASVCTLHHPETHAEYEASSSRKAAMQSKLYKLIGIASTPGVGQIV